MRVILILTLYLIPLISNAQSRTVIGKVVDENLETLPGVRIQTRDTILLGETDIDGNFKIELPFEVNELIVSWVGMEWTSIKLLPDCNNFEIILLYDANYDFMTMQAVNRKRYRRFKNLKNLHKQAKDKGIFTSSTPCQAYKFKKY